jgi:hypothetical protein
LSRRLGGHAVARNSPPVLPSPLTGSVLECENILRAKPRPITSDEEIIRQPYESDNDDRDQWTRAPAAENVGVNGQWVDDRKRETIRTRRVVGCPGQKKSNRSNQAATMKDRSRKNLSRKESQNYRRRVDRRGVGRH